MTGEPMAGMAPTLTLDSFDFENDPEAIRTLLNLPNGQGDALLNSATPEQQEVILRATRKLATGGLSGLAPQGSGPGSKGIETITEALVPEVTEIGKGTAVPIAYGLGSAAGRMTRVPGAGRLAGALAATATDVALNKVKPAVENWWHNNIANPFDAPEQAPSGPLTASDVATGMVETPLQLVGMAGARSVGKVGYKQKQAAVRRVKDFISHYAKDFTGAVDKKTGRITSSIDDSISLAMDMGILGRTEKEALFAGDEAVLGRIQLALGGDDISEGAIPVLAEKLHGLITSSGKGISPSDVMGVLAKVKGKLSSEVVSDSFIEKYANLTAESREAAYAGMKVLDNKIGELLSRQGAATEPMFLDRPLEWLHHFKRALQKQTDYNPATMDNNKAVKNAVLMRAAEMVKTSIEDLVERTFAETGGGAALKQTNAALGKLMDLRSLVDGAVDQFAKGGAVSRLPRLPQMTASMGGAGAALYAAGQPEFAAVGAASVPAIYGAIHFVGNASNQMRLAHLQNMSANAFNFIANIVGQTGEFSVFPRSLADLSRNAINIKRQLSLAAVDPSIVNAVDGALSIQNPDSRARRLADLMSNSPAGEYLDAMLYRTSRGYKSLFEDGGTHRLYDKMEIVDFSNHLASKMTPENELEISEKRRRLHKDGTVDLADLEPSLLTEPRPVELSATIETPDKKPSALSTLAGNMRQSYDY